MTSYTYKPLVGMTSQCDVDNRVVRYEYDRFGRLARIRDANNNILKQYDYKYQGGISSYGSDGLSETLAKNDCGVGQIGTNETYSLPANTYYSAISKANANAKAVADTTANGQTYANAHGSCLNVTAYVRLEIIPTDFEDPCDL